MAGESHKNTCGCAVTLNPSVVQRDAAVLRRSQFEEFSHPMQSLYPPPSSSLSPRRPFAPMKFPGTSFSFLFPVPVRGFLRNLPSVSSCPLRRATSAAGSQSHLPLADLSLSLSSGSRVRSPGNSDELFARDRPFKSRFVPGIRLEIARNFVEAASSGLSRLQRLVKSLTMLRN